MTAVFAFKKDLLTIQNPADSSEWRDFRCFLIDKHCLSLQSNAHRMLNVCSSYASYDVSPTYYPSQLSLTIYPFLSFFAPRCPVRATSAGAFPLSFIPRHPMPASRMFISAGFYPAF